MRTAVALLLLPFAVWGQIELFTVTESGVESPAPGLIDLGTVAPGDLLDTRFRVRNTGAATATLQSLRISGPGFSLQGNPTGSQILTPNANVDFRVRFQPVTTGVHNAFLTANERMVVIRGEAPAGIAIGLDRGGTFERVTNTSAVDFGRVDAGTISSLRFLLRNEGAAAATVRRIAITGIFAGPVDLSLPATIPPGGQARFGVLFAPARAGVYRGQLSIDDRVIELEGLAVNPPLPSANLLFGNAGSGQQAILKIQFNAPVLGRGTMTLKMRFEPAVGATDDPGVAILPAGSREVSYPVEPGDYGRDVTIQTGTTAGRIRLRLEEAGRLMGESAPIDIPAAPVRLSSVTATRQSGSVEISISGFDNTRGASEVLFTFYSGSGQPLGAGPVRASIRDQFEQYFRDSAVGGLFRMQAVFPVTGDASALAGVLVEMQNPAGSSRSERITF